MPENFNDPARLSADGLAIGPAPSGSQSRRREPAAAAGPQKISRSVVPSWVWVLAGVAAFAGYFAHNSWLTSASILVLPALLSLLWVRGEPPVLAFACVMQWVQSTVVVFYTDYYGYSLEAVAGGPELKQATYLSLAGVVALALGIRLALVGRRPVDAAVAAESLRLDPPRIFTLYLVSLAFFLLSPE